MTTKRAATLALPVGWTVRPYFRTGHQLLGSRDGWLLSDVDGNDYYAPTLAKAQRLAERQAQAR